MITNTSRRAVLAGAAALPAMSLPTIARGAHPDAGLLAMKPRWQKALAESDARTARHEAESDAYHAAEIPMPDACRHRPSDVEALGSSFREGAREGYYDRHQIEEIRSLGETRRDFVVEKAEDVGGGKITWSSVPRAVDRARVNEIVTAFDEWAASDKALQRKHRVDKHDDEGDEVCGAVYALEDEIMAMPASTLEGRAFKATVSLYEINCSRSLAEAEAAEESDVPSRFLIGLARDILTLHSGAQAT